MANSLLRTTANKMLGVTGGRFGRQCFRFAYDTSNRALASQSPRQWHTVLDQSLPKTDAMPELTTAKSVLLTDLALCVNRYRLFTPGIYVCLHVPVLLDAHTRIVPGLVAMVNHGVLKQCEPVEHGFEGPPNFILDVFDTEEMAEYESRKKTFEKFGVTEYVAVENLDCPKLHWNRHDGSRFVTAAPDGHGVIKSLALPGLWIAVPALAARDWWTILAAIERGVTRLGHHEFQETIWHKGGRSTQDNVIPYEAG